MKVVPEESGKFGSDLGSYELMLKAGIVFIIIAIALIGVGIMLFPETIISLIGVVFLFLAILVGLSGYIGVKDEMKKKGKKRIYTGFGEASAFIGGFSAIIIFGPWFSIPLGALAIVLGKRGLDKGDNTYASAGIIAGIVGVIGGAVIWAMFYFTGNMG